MGKFRKVFRHLADPRADNAQHELVDTALGNERPLPPGRFGACTTHSRTCCPVGRVHQKMIRAGTPGHPGAGACPIRAPGSGINGSGLLLRPRQRIGPGKQPARPSMVFRPRLRDLAPFGR
jgi:hypothetical protein